MRKDKNYLTDSESLVETFSKPMLDTEFNSCLAQLWNHENITKLQSIRMTVFLLDGLKDIIRGNINIDNLNSVELFIEYLKTGKAESDALELYYNFCCSILGNSQENSLDIIVANASSQLKKEGLSIKVCKY